MVPISCTCLRGRTQILLQSSDCVTSFTSSLFVDELDATLVQLEDDRTFAHGIALCNGSRLPRQDHSCQGCVHAKHATCICREDFASDLAALFGNLR